MSDMEFRRVTLEDKPVINEFLMKYPSRSCERTFANLLLWSGYYPVTYAIIERTLVFRSTQDGMAFTYPAGEEEDIKSAIGYLREYAGREGFPFRLYLVTPEQFRQLDAWYPGVFEIEYDRDSADYVYESEKLATLSGKRLHGKRNHIHRFEETYGNWRYEPMSGGNLEECVRMAQIWRKQNECDADEEKSAEMCVTLGALRLFKELGLIGGVLRADGRVVAFTIGEPVSDEMFVVHIEKAFADVEGAYTMINQQFVEHECMRYRYINREDDVGAPGLRKAKLSYHPAFMVEKGLVTEKGNIL